MRDETDLDSADFGELSKTSRKLKEALQNLWNFELLDDLPTPAKPKRVKQKKIKPERKDEMKDRSELYNIHVDVLFRLREPDCANKMDSADLNTIHFVVSDLIWSYARDKINHPFLANSAQGMRTADQIRHRMKLRGTRMFLMAARGGIVCDSVRELGLNEDSVMADAAWVAEKVIGLLGNSRMKINFIVRAEVLVERPDGAIERLPYVVLCDRLEEREK